MESLDGSGSPIDYYFLQSCYPYRNGSLQMLVVWLLPKGLVSGKADFLLLNLDSSFLIYHMDW